MLEALGKLGRARSSLNDMHRALLGVTVPYGSQGHEAAKERERL
jgi:hypothetical protein